MSHDEIIQDIKKSLIKSGLVGIIDLKSARKIATAVLESKKYPGHIVDIELSPVHRVGKPILCNSLFTKVKIRAENKKSNSAM